jgi:hypothetical protein
MKMNKQTTKLLARVEEIAPELADELRGSVAHDLTMSELTAKERRAHDELRSTIDRYSYDATGQDGEREIEQAASDYISAQTERYEAGLCPDQLAEMRMGA